MLKFLASGFLTTVSMCTLGLGIAVAANPIQLRINAVAEKHDVDVVFKRGAVASIGVDDSVFNGIKGLTSAFDGQDLPLYLIFKAPMDFDRAAVLAEHPGKLEGVARCVTVQKGDSPDIPSVKLAVLAQNCTVTSVKY